MNIKNKCSNCGEEEIGSQGKIIICCNKEMERSPLESDDGQMSKPRVPSFIIDDSALKDFFEGKNKERSDDLLKKLKEMNDGGKGVVAVTTLSAFLRAIYLSDPKVKIGKIQKTLSFLRVAPSFADFKKEEAVRDEIIQFAETMSKERQ